MNTLLSLIIIFVLISVCLYETTTNKTIITSQSQINNSIPVFTTTPIPDPIIKIIGANKREELMIKNAINNTDKDITKHISTIEVINNSSVRCGITPSIHEEHYESYTTIIRTVGCNRIDSENGDHITLIAARYYDNEMAYSDNNNYTSGSFEMNLYHEIGHSVGSYKYDDSSEAFADNYANDYAINHREKLIEG